MLIQFKEEKKIETENKLSAFILVCPFKEHSSENLWC